MHKPKQQNPGARVLFCSLIIGGLFSAQSSATEVSNGEMAGAIRSADYPCAQVLKIDSDGNNAWLVECNSGKFSVSRDQGGNFTVTQTD